MNNFAYNSIDEVPSFLMNQVLTSMNVKHNDVTIEDVNRVLNSIYTETDQDWPWKDSGIENFM